MNQNLLLSLAQVKKISLLFAKEIRLAEQAKEKSSLSFDKNLLFIKIYCLKVGSLTLKEVFCR